MSDVKITISFDDPEELEQIKKRLDGIMTKCKVKPPAKDGKYKRAYIYANISNKH